MITEMTRTADYLALQGLARDLCESLARAPARAARRARAFSKNAAKIHDPLASAALSAIGRELERLVLDDPAEAGVLATAAHDIVARYAMPDAKRAHSEAAQAA